MSKYKLYGAKIKKDKIDSTGTTDQGQNIEPIIKEMVDSNLSTAPAADISNLQGVDTTGANDGDVLAYDQASGEWKPETVSGANITEGTLNTATSNRTVDLGGNNLTVTNGSHTFVSTNFGVDAAQSFLVGPDNQIYTNAGSGNFSRIMTNSTYAQMANNSSAGFSAITVDNTNTITIKSDAGLYKLGNNTTSTPRSYNTLTTVPSNLSINGVTGEVFKTDTTLKFLSSTQINAAVTSSPTEAEVLAFLQSLATSVRSANLNRFYYYTGSTSDTDPATHYYYLTGDEKLISLTKSQEVKSYIQTSINNGSAATAYAPQTFASDDITVGSSITTNTSSYRKLSENKNYRITVTIPFTTAANAEAKMYITSFDGSTTTNIMGSEQLVNTGKGVASMSKIIAVGATPIDIGIRANTSTGTMSIWNPNSSIIIEEL